MTNITCDMLLHPELLTNEQLISIIQERHLRVPNMECMARDDLLDLFHNFCVPYGQRKYRDSGRGKMLNKTRQKSPESTPKYMFNDIRSLKQSHLINSSDERLKPPPDILSGHIKRIKIENKITITNDINNYKRKVPIDSFQLTNCDGPPQKKERKQITWP